MTADLDIGNESSVIATKTGISSHFELKRIPSEEVIPTGISLLAKLRGLEKLESNSVCSILFVLVSPVHMNIISIWPARRPSSQTSLFEHHVLDHFMYLARLIIYASKPTWCVLNPYGKGLRQFV